MKCALVLEKDLPSSRSTAQKLRWLGYVAAPVRTPDEALNVASAINFDVIVTCTANIPGDRRSLTGELERAAPEAAIILIAERGDDNAALQTEHYSSATTVIRRPASLDVFRRVLEFGIDGYGMQPACGPNLRERRKRCVQYTKPADPIRTGMAGHLANDAHPGAS